MQLLSRVFGWFANVFLRICGSPRDWDLKQPTVCCVPEAPLSEVLTQNTLVRRRAHGVDQGGGQAVLNQIRTIWLKFGESPVEVRPNHAF